MISAAIFLAGGRGSRMRGSVDDKVLAQLAGRPVLEHSVSSFIKMGAIQEWVFVYRDDEQRQRIFSMASFATLQGGVRFVQGGQERQDSVINALESLPECVDYVFIHDGARPLVQPESLLRLHEAVIRAGAAVLSHRVTDTIKRLSGKAGASLSSCALEDLDRSTLWGMETPQVFKRSVILEAYRKVKRENLRITDDVAAAALVGQLVTLVENPVLNPKITAPEDLAFVEFLIPRIGALPMSVKK